MEIVIVYSTSGADMVGYETMEVTGEESFHALDALLNDERPHRGARRMIINIFNSDKPVKAMK